MATKKLFAWTDLVTRVDGERKIIRAGTEVTRTMLDDLDDKQWGELLRTGVLRDKEFPPIDRSTSNVLSPIQYYRNLAKEAEEAVEQGFETQLTAVLDPDEVS